MLKPQTPRCFAAPNNDRSLLFTSCIHKKAMVNRHLLFFPSLHCFPFWLNPQSGSALQKQPVSSKLKMSCFSWPCTISGSVSFHEVTVSPLTSPDSPHIVTLFTLNHFFHFESHPLVPSKSGFPEWVAISFAFATNCGPPGYIFFEHTILYHWYNLSYTSENLDTRHFCL